MRLLVKRAECNSHWISGISKEPLWFFQWKTFFSTDTPSIPDTIGEILSGNECGTRIHTEKQLFSFIFFFFSSNGWMEIASGSRSEWEPLHVFPRFILLWHFIDSQGFILRNKISTMWKDLPIMLWSKIQSSRGVSGFKGDVILWYEARLNLNADWLLSHCTTGPVCV